MSVTQEFLVIPASGKLCVYGVGQLPERTAVGSDARRLRLVGPVWVKPPHAELTEPQWDAWQAQLRAAGFSVRVEPFWTTAPSGHFLSLSEVVDELLNPAR